MTAIRLARTSLALLLAAAPASLRADNDIIQHDRWVDSFAYTDDTTCAFPVSVTGSANDDDALFFDADGDIERLLTTVNHAFIFYSANGRQLTARGSGGIEYTFNDDGSVSVSTFGINLLLTIPQYGAVILDTGHAEYLLDHHHFSEIFHAGPASYDVPAFCAALSN